MVMDAASPTFGWGDHLDSMREPEPPNLEALQFYDLLKNAEQPLYEGCSKSRLATVVDFLIIKSEAGIAEKYYDRLMSTVKGFCPMVIC